MLPHTSVLAFPSLKKSRRYGAKVKTGCKTCKNRRVKCDELRPYCSRCTSTGRKCDGYAQDLIVDVPANTQKSRPLSRNITPTLSGSSDGLHYLEFYHYCAGPLLSSKFDNGFWSRTALQMAHSESAIRHALVALGYLHQTEPGNLKHARSVFTSGYQNRTFLFHYNTAVRSLIDRMNEPSYVPEVGLVTCLLFVCIEFIRGNYHAAFAHLKGGLKIISEWQNERLKGLLGDSPCPQTLLEVRNGFLGPTTEIEDNLLPMFNRTLTSALLYGVDVQQIFEFPRPIPRRFHEHPFTSISEAQTSNLDLRNPTILFLRAMAKKLILREPITNEDIRMQMHLLECHHAWFQALKMLEKELSTEDKTKASSLKVAYYATYIALACGLEITQTPYDAHISSFKALVNHANIVLESSRGLYPTPSPSTIETSTSPSVSGDIEILSPPKSNPHRSANFTFEISLIPCLYLTATRCRCPVTRREAVSLLAMDPPREGLWDAEQHLAVANRVIEIEEKEVDPDTGWPVENARLWCAVIDGDMDQNGGFWVIFALANWVQAGSQLERGDKERRRLDAQWEEWFVL